MSAITSDEYARTWSERLVENEMRRSGLTASAARARVASRIGATPGTLENLNRKRLKGVREWLFSRLLNAVVAEIEKEIAALQHEHKKLLALGCGPDDRTVETVVAGLARLRGLLSAGGLDGKSSDAP